MSASAASAFGGLTFQSVSTNSQHSCGVTTAGPTYCWGRNQFGQLGDGTFTNRDAPVAVSGGLTFQSVSAGSGHSCGVTTAGAAFCWGRNVLGALGDGTNTSTDVPVAVSGGLTFQSVGAGAGQSCGVTTAGPTYCWGWNGFGQLGDGTNTDSNVPVAVSGGLTFQSVSVGNHSCGVTAAGAAFCWGRNVLGALGNGTDGSSTNTNVPVAVSGGLTFRSVIRGSLHSCGVTTAGAAHCWGDNINGGLGNGTDGRNTSTNVPVAVSGGLTFQSVGAGVGHSCGVTTAGAAFCWGRNDLGQLGGGTSGGGTSSNVPVAVSGGLTFQWVDGGTFRSCGLTTAGAAYCWGRNQHGELGDGTNTDSNVPVAVSISPALRLDFLIADVQALIDGGLLDQGGNGLLGILDAALGSIQGDRPSASRQLNAFITAVEGFITGGLLTAAQGQALIDAAQSIIDQLST